MNNSSKRILKISSLVFIVIFSIGFFPTEGASTKTSTIKIMKLETIEGYSFPVIEISSESGIGTSKIRFPYDKVKTRFGIKLNLKGLENLIISGKKFSHQVSVNSTSGEVFQEIALRNTPNGWLKVSKQSVFWLKVRKSTNLDFFEIVIPPTVSQYLGRELTIKWIDFYR
jgi:hypothetical protein